ncbi:MAG TPA: lysophospholipid acyltransferase family protein [Caulobacteraceae bacterium]
MRALRSFLFVIWLYGSMAVIAVGGSPALLMNHAAAMKVVRAWALTALFGARWILGLTVEIRGREHAPTGPGLVAAKHQSMLDIIAPFAVMDDACFVMKKELMSMPFLGWFAWKTGMIPVDRSAAAKALKDMVARGRHRLARGQQIVIFPEGTRTLPGAEPDYKPGVAGLYRDLEAPCWPVATNSGRFWPAKGFDFKPGVAVYEFLPVIPAGMKRGPFMVELQSRIETASAKL